MGTCSDPKTCFTNALRKIQKSNYRLECEAVKPQICETVTRAKIAFSGKCTPPGCPITDGFKIDVCPCQQSDQCFDGESCSASKECPCTSVDCPALSPQVSFLKDVKKDECGCSGDTPCLLDFQRPTCDVCNGRKDKPRKLILRWVATAGTKSSVMFASVNNCVMPTKLTSNSDSNEVVLGCGASKLPTDLYFKVDGATGYLHASCSQPLNIGDVIYQVPNKGSLILVGFQSISGRTESACGRPTQTCGPRTASKPSVKCSAGITVPKLTSKNGVPLRINSDGSIQYLWGKSQSRNMLSTDQIEYIGVSCDGEKVKGKVVITLDMPKTEPKPADDQKAWKLVGAETACDTSAGEVYLEGSSKFLTTLAQCKKLCTDSTHCQSITFFTSGWCALFSTPCVRTKKSTKAKAFHLTSYLVKPGERSAGYGAAQEDVGHNVTHKDATDVGTIDTEAEASANLKGFVSDDGSITVGSPFSVVAIAVLCSVFAVAGFN